MDTFRTSGSRSQRLLSTDEDFVLLSEKRRNKKALHENGMDSETVATNKNRLNTGSIFDARYVPPSSHNNLMINDHGGRLLSKSISNTDSMIYDNPNASHFKMFGSNRKDSDQSELRIISSQMAIDTNINNNRHFSHMSHISNASFGDVNNNDNNIDNNNNNNSHSNSINNSYNINNNNNHNNNKRMKNSHSQGGMNDCQPRGSVSEMTAITNNSNKYKNSSNVGTRGTDFILPINDHSLNINSVNTDKQLLLLNSLNTTQQEYYNMDHINNENDLINNGKNGQITKGMISRSHTLEQEKLENQNNNHSYNYHKNNKLRSMSHNQSSHDNNNHGFNRLLMLSDQQSHIVKHSKHRNHNNNNNSNNDNNTNNNNNNLNIDNNKNINSFLLLNSSMGNKSHKSGTMTYDESVDKLLLSRNFPCWLWICCPILCPIAMLYIFCVGFINPRCFMTFNILFHFVLDWTDELTDLAIIYWLKQEEYDKIENNTIIFYLYVGGILLNHCCNLIYCFIIRNLWRFDDLYFLQYPHLKAQIKNIPRWLQILLGLFSGILNCATFNLICKWYYLRKNEHRINQIYIEYDYPCSKLKRVNEDDDAMNDYRAYIERLKQLDSNIIQIEFTNMLEREAMHSPLLVLVQLTETIFKIISFALLYETYSIDEWVNLGIAPLILAKIIIIVVCLIIQFKTCAIACDDYTFLERYGHN